MAVYGKRSNYSKLIEHDERFDEVKQDISSFKDEILTAMDG